jgi:hypothetical protein
MAKTIGRNPIEIIDSYPYSEIIFIVASGDNYPQVVAEKRKREVSPTAKQMNELKEKGFLISINEKEKRNFPQNRKYFSVNWDKISEEFVDYIFNKYQREYLQLSKRKALSRYLSYNRKYELIKNKDFEKSIKKNEYVQVILKFSFYGDPLKKKTIKEVFEGLRILLYNLRKYLEGVHTPDPKIDDVTQKDVNEFVKKTSEGKARDTQYNQFARFIEIAKGLSDPDLVQGIYHLQDYLQKKHSLLNCPDNRITIKQVLEDIDSYEIKSLVEANPDLEEVINKISKKK